MRQTPEKSPDTFLVCRESASVFRLSTSAAEMNDRWQFNPLQAQEVATAFAEAGVDYLFIGKGGAILLGFPGTTQDVDVFPCKDEENGRRIVAAVRKLGFVIDDSVERDIIASKRASNRMKDRMDLHLLDLFQIEYEARRRG
jgi:hypothetical protein